MANCAGCGKEMVWARTPSGKAAPIEREPSPEKGNVILLKPTLLGGDVLAVTLSGDLLAEVRQSERATQLHLNHFAYCPQREEFLRG